MKTSEGNIRVSKISEGILSVSVMMPKWEKTNIEDLILINLPLLGLETIAVNEEDIDTAIDEAIESFCHQSERFGRGLVKELISLGWKTQIESESDTVLVFEMSSNKNTVKDIIIERIMETGDQYSHIYQLEEVA